MICRAEKDGWLLISQMAHAWLAGKLAAAWGNQEFVKPSPWEAVVLATRLHDIGWLSWDAAPRLDQEGRPVNFLDTSLEETIPLWRRAVRHVSLIDPFSGLLVSQHASTIYRRRLERQADPPEKRSEVETMLDEQDSIQAALQDKLLQHSHYGPAADPLRLYAAYRWLRVCDRLSLALCSDVISPSDAIKEVPRDSWTEYITLQYQRPEPFKLMLDPYPFAQPTIHLAIQARRLDQANFPSQTAYWAAIKRAPWRQQTITVTAANTKRSEPSSR